MRLFARFPGHGASNGRSVLHCLYPHQISAVTDYLIILTLFSGAAVYIKVTSSWPMFVIGSMGQRMTDMDSKRAANKCIATALVCLLC